MIYLASIFAILLANPGETPGSIVEKDPRPNILFIMSDDHAW